jgi:hypothetical protein
MGDRRRSGGRISRLEAVFRARAREETSVNLRRDRGER